MPVKCCVNGCSGSLRKSFFYIPAVLKFRSPEKIELSKRRRKLWLDALGLEDDDSTARMTVCSDHFITGRPAALEDTSDIDWVPSLYLKMPSLVTVKKQKRLKEDSIQKTNVVLKDKEKNYNLRKSDTKKVLNCKVLLDGNLRCNTFNGTNGSGLALIQKHGTFTSQNVKLTETAINNTVLRIHLIRQNLYDLQRKYRSVKRKRKEDPKSSFDPQTKKRLVLKDGWDSTSSEIPYITSTRKFNRGPPFVNMKENKTPTAHSKLQSKLISPQQSSEKMRTLNRVIRKNNKEKIKVKFFPKTSSTPVRNSVKNGSISKIDEGPLSLHREILFVNQYKNPIMWQNIEPTYYLKFPFHRVPEEGKLKYPFQKLVMDVKNMKLPGPSWKIKVIIKQGKISAITFTNKMDPERCIAFSAGNSAYKLVIDNRPAILLGSPGNLSSSTDLEILMDIVHNIETSNPMIFYK